MKNDGMRATGQANQKLINADKLMDSGRLFAPNNEHKEKTAFMKSIYYNPTFRYTIEDNRSLRRKIESAVAGLDDIDSSGIQREFADFGAEIGEMIVDKTQKKVYLWAMAPMAFLIIGMFLI